MDNDVVGARPRAREPPRTAQRISIRARLEPDMERLSARVAREGVAVLVPAARIGQHPVNRASKTVIGLADDRGAHRGAVCDSRHPRNILPVYFGAV